MLSVFTTRRLWQRILQPWESHPLFQQVTPEPFQPRRQNALYWVGVGVVILNPCTIAMTTFTIIPVVLFGLAGVIFGLKLAFGVSSVIAAQKETGRFDLLKLTPPGEYGIYMLLVQAMFRRKNVLLGFGVERDLIYQTLLAFAVAVGIAFALFRLSVGGFFLAFALIALGLHIDFRQSIVLGTLCALLASAYTDTRLNARLIAMVSYTGIQLVWYLVGIVGVSLAARAVGTLDDLAGVFGVVAQVMVLVAMFAMREGLITVMDDQTKQASA